MLYRLYKLGSFANINPGFPTPLVNKKHQIAIFFSAKGGCTFLAKWFFLQIGHFDNAKLGEDFMLNHNYVHNYRRNKYYPSDEFKKAKAHFLSTRGKDYLKIKLIRNPFERAVSSYIHFLYHLSLKKKHINTEFGISLDDSAYSFEQFLTMLQGLNITKCNNHWCIQYQRAEEYFNMDEIIPLRDATGELRRIETKYQLQRTDDFSQMIRSNHHAQNKSMKHEFCGDTKFTYAIQQNRPPSKYFYNKRLEALVVKIYQKDFEKYDFQPFYNVY